MKKKTIAILLVLVIGMVGVFADGTDPAYVNNESADLTLKTTITEKYGLIIADRSVVSGSKGQDLGDYSIMDQYADFTGASGLITAALSELVFTNNSLEKDIYVNFMTNMPNKASVTTTANPLQTTKTVEGTTTVISTMEYLVTVGINSAITVGTVGQALTFYSENSATHSLRIGSEAVKIKIEQSTWDLAASGAYEAVWTINLKID